MARRTELDDITDRIARGVPRSGRADCGFDYSVPLIPQPPAEPEPTTHVHVHMPAPQSPAFTSIPVWTDWVGGTLFTIILVNGKRQTFQLYAVDLDTWVMVGLFGLYVDALAEVQAWRVYFANGFTLADWQKDHPEGIQPLLPGER